MPDESWDTGGKPPATKSSGMRTFLKVALGCFVLGLLGIGSCVGLLGFGAHSAIKATGNEWAHLAGLGQKLETEDGTRAVWEESPALHTSYPTAEDLEAIVASWRPHLGPIPATPPAIWSGRMSTSIKVDNGKKSSTLEYKYDNGTWIRTTWEEGKLVTIAVDPASAPEAATPTP